MKPFRFARVNILEDGAAKSLMTSDVKDASELKDLIDMKRSYRKNPLTNRDVFTDYKYTVAMISHGCRFNVNYMSPNKIEVSTMTERTSYLGGIIAAAVYKKATGSLHITALDIVVGANIYADPCEDYELTDQLALMIGLFGNLRKIAPVVFADKIKVEYNVFVELPDPSDKTAMSCKVSKEKIARYSKAVTQRVVEFNVLGKLDA